MPSKANIAVPKKSGYFFQPATIGRLWGSGIFWRKKEKNNASYICTYFKEFLNERAKSHTSQLNSSKYRMG